MLLVHILPVLFELAQVISQLVDFVSSMLFEFRLRHHARLLHTQESKIIKTVTYGKMVVDCVVTVLDALQMIGHGVVSVLKLLLLLTEDVGLVA